MHPRSETTRILSLVPCFMSIFTQFRANFMKFEQNSSIIIVFQVHVRVLDLKCDMFTGVFVAFTGSSQLRCMWLKHVYSIHCTNCDVGQPWLLIPRLFHSRFAMGGWGIFAGFCAYLKCIATTGFASNITLFQLSYDWLGYYLMLWCTGGLQPQWLWILIPSIFHPVTLRVGRVWLWIRRVTFDGTHHLRVSRRSSFSDFRNYICGDRRILCDVINPHEKKIDSQNEVQFFQSITNAKDREVWYNQVDGFSTIASKAGLHSTEKRECYSALGDVDSNALGTDYNSAEQLKLSVCKSFLFSGTTQSNYAHAVRIETSVAAWRCHNHVATFTSCIP